MENMEGTENIMSEMEQRVRQALDVQGQQFHDVFEQLQARIRATEEELTNARLAGQQEVPVSNNENGADQGLRGTATRYGCNVLTYDIIRNPTDADGCRRMPTDC